MQARISTVYRMYVRRGWDTNTSFPASGLHVSPQHSLCISTVGLLQYRVPYVTVHITVYRMYVPYNDSNLACFLSLLPHYMFHHSTLHALYHRQSWTDSCTSHLPPPPRNIVRPCISLSAGNVEHQSVPKSWNLTGEEVERKSARRRD